MDNFLCEQVDFYSDMFSFDFDSHYLTIDSKHFLHFVIDTISQ